jgi:hypothetical protein
VDTVRDPQGSCGFCDGTGLWADPERGPAAYDPCPHCDGSGCAPSAAANLAGEDTRPSLEPVLPAVLSALARLSPAERQRVYEELYTRWDCRIFRA